MKWTLQAVVLIGVLIGGCAMERGSGEDGDGGAVAPREVARDEQSTTAGALRGSGERRGRWCSRDPGSGAG